MAQKKKSKTSKAKAAVAKLMANKDLSPEAKKHLVAQAATLPKPKSKSKSKSKKAASKKSAPKAATKKSAPKKKTAPKKASKPAKAKTSRKKTSRKKSAPKKAATRKKASSKKMNRAEVAAAAAGAALAATPAKPKRAKRSKKSKKSKRAKKSGSRKKKAATKKAAPKKAKPATKPAKAKTSRKRSSKSSKRSSKKSGTKRSSKKSKKKGKGRRRKVSSATTISVRGRKMPKSAKRARKGMSRVSTTRKYQNKKTGRKLSIIQRFANPVGNWGNVAVLGGGVLVGYVTAEIIDRIVATRAGDAKYPYYAHDAAMRIMARPDAMRLAAQAGVMVAFFVGSYAAQKRMPKTAYFLAGAAIGAGVHVVAQAVMQYALPLVLKVTKGNERSFPNRVLPMEQAALQDANAKLIADEAKDWKSQPSQQGTDEFLPDSYLYPVAAAAPAAGTNPAGTECVPGRGRVTPTVIAGPSGVGTPALNSPRPQIISYPQPARQPVVASGPRSVGQPPVQAQHQPSQAYLGEPVAGRAPEAAQAAPAIRTAPIGVGSHGDCPGCAAGLKRDQDVQDGLNVRAKWPTGAAIDVTGDAPQPMPSDESAAAPGVTEVFQSGVPGPRSEVGVPSAFNRFPVRADGRPRGTMRRMSAEAGLAGTPSQDRAGHKSGLKKHLSS